MDAILLNMNPRSNLPTAVSENYNVSEEKRFQKKNSNLSSLNSISKGLSILLEDKYKIFRLVSIKKVKVNIMR